MTENSDWRIRRRDATHRRIFTTALGLFEELGYDSVSVSQIARDAEVSIPTFYAHYPSKEQLIMAMLPADVVGALIAAQPEGIPIHRRIHRAASTMFASMPPDEHEQLIMRWRIIAGSPVLRLRAAEYERATAGQVLDHLASMGGGPPSTADVVRTGAAFAAFTAALLAWADSDGERKLGETLDEAFDALVE